MLAESSIVGQAIGMSLSGLKPVCEIQFEGFIYPAMNQIVTQAAKMTTRWNDEAALNLVIRVPVGGAFVPSSITANRTRRTSRTPLVCMSRFRPLPPDAAAMLKYSTSLGSPVIFFEPKRLYWKRRQQPRELEPATPLSARIVRRGSDITVVGFGATRGGTAAADRVSSTTDVEVVDLRWVAPMDTDTVLESVVRTGRLLVVQEAVGFSGVGAELVATVAEHGSIT